MTGLVLPNDLDEVARRAGCKPSAIKRVHFDEETWAWLIPNIWSDVHGSRYGKLYVPPGHLVMGEKAPLNAVRHFEGKK